MRAPQEPFAVWVFCEDAQATHLGVVYAGHMTSPSDGAWQITDRFWQSSDWASDVHTFAWSKDGERLYVSTGAVYGTSSLFELSLRERKARKLSGPHPDSDVEITRLTSRDVEFRLRDIEKGAVVERRLRLTSPE